MRSKIAGFAPAAFPALMAACSPLVQPEVSSNEAPAVAITPIAPASTPPLGWQRVNFVSGLSVAAPATAKVVYPQGIDSTVLEISGRDYSVTFDDYGPFATPVVVALRLAGRPAHETTQSKDDCRHRVVQIELPEKWTLMSCMPEEKQCTVPNAKATMSSFCKGAVACAAVDTMIGSARLAPGPQAPLPRLDPNWRPPEKSVCSVE